MVALLPCSYNHVPMTPFFCNIALCSNRLYTFAYWGLYANVLFSPQWQDLDNTQITSNLTHAATFVWSNMNTEDENISPLMTHLKHQSNGPEQALV